MMPTLFRKRRGDLSQLFNEFDDVFGSFLVDSDQSTAFFPKVDIHEDDESVYIDADLPGLSKDDININIENNVLTLSGKREDSKEDKKNGYYRFERHSGEFKRSFNLGDQLDSSATEANFKDGVLNIVIPKREDLKPKQIDVQVN